jgi:hypothetical protein
LIEFLHRLFARDNVYCMLVCSAFLGLWFHFSRSDETQVITVHNRRRKQQQTASQF